MSTVEKGRPAGFHTVTPYLIIKGAAAAMAFYARAFDAFQGDSSHLVHIDQFASAIRGDLDIGVTHRGLARLVDDVVTHDPGSACELRQADRAQRNRSPNDPDLSALGS